MVVVGRTEEEKTKGDREGEKKERKYKGEKNGRKRDKGTNSVICIQ